MLLNIINPNDALLTGIKHNILDLPFEYESILFVWIICDLIFSRVMPKKFTINGIII